MADTPSSSSSSSSSSSFTSFTIHARGISWAPSPLGSAHQFLSSPAKLDDSGVYKSFMFRKTMVVVACLLAAVVVVAHWSTAMRFILFLLSRCRSWWLRRRSGDAGQSSSPTMLDGLNQGMVLLGTFKAQREDANSQALRPIQMVQVGSHPKSSSLIECMICLSEFQCREKIGLLPGCGHGFHRPCIEMWLFTHSNCPICRHSLELVEEDQV